MYPPKVLLLTSPSAHKTIRTIEMVHIIPVSSEITVSGGVALTRDMDLSFAITIPVEPTLRYGVLPYM